MKKLILMAIALITLATTVNAATWINCANSKYGETLVTIVSQKNLQNISPNAEIPVTVYVRASGTLYVGIVTIHGLDRRIDFGGIDGGKKGYNYILYIKADGSTGYYDFTSPNASTENGMDTTPLAGRFYCE